MQSEDSMIMNQLDDMYLNPQYSSIVDASKELISNRMIQVSRKCHLLSHFEILLSSQHVKTHFDRLNQKRFHISEKKNHFLRF